MITFAATKIYEVYHMFYCGIDIAIYKHEASVIDTNGKVLIDSISFANAKQGCEKILTVFEKNKITPTDVIIGMETTGNVCPSENFSEIFLTFFILGIDFLQPVFIIAFGC